MKPKIFKKREKQKTKALIKRETDILTQEEYEQKHKEVMQKIHDLFDEVPPPPDEQGII